MKAIQSAANAEFKRWRRLAGNSRFMKSQGRTLAEGLHLARAALDAGHPVAAALVRAGASGPELDACLARIDDARIHELAAPLFDALAPVEHSTGLMLELPFERGAEPRRLTGDVVYLEGVQDPGNIGALLRVAAAAGVSAVLAGPATAALWSPKALRAGQGAHFGLRLFEDVGLEALDAWFAGRWIGTAARDATSLWDARLPEGEAGWMLGSEGAGLSAAALERCALRVSIPLAAGVESLNVASAAAVCLFERQRRRRT